MHVDPSFWQGKKVLLTGHTGFKGSWLSLWLQRLGAEVVGFSSDRAPTTPALFEDARVAEGMASCDIADIRDAAAVRDVLARHRPDVVLHLAAQPLVRKSYREPADTFATNVMGTVNVLDAVRQVGSARVVVNVTSDKCYENKGWEWAYREDEAKGGADPYSASKACSELVTTAFRKSYFGPGEGVALASGRAGNVIGGGDWAEDRLIPDFMRAALANEVVQVRNPHATRPWQHVLNPLSGYLVLVQHLWEHPEDADGYNFGPEDRDARPVGWIADRLTELWDGLRWAHDGGEHPPEANYLKVDSSRAWLRLGWEPVWNLEDALRSIVDWYRVYRDAGDVRGVTLEQIDAFTAAAGRAAVPA